ncbi:hypothetical protein CDAR_238901 [Caerostris darwini]|uniref:Uncharacterized protein n=1 Tax=Caerostris darwini TaxID=1538125 RepID=A0AAV4PUQ5_9ARAC|nr:hypothetical protein CDAR_238901 [Caerostris darwini]
MCQHILGTEAALRGVVKSVEFSCVPVHGGSGERPRPLNRRGGWRLPPHWHSGRVAQIGACYGAFLPDGETAEDGEEGAAPSFLPARLDGGLWK